MKKILEQINWKDQGKKTLLIRVPVFDRDWVTLFKKEFGVEWRLDRTHFTEYTDSQFHEEMEAAGIRVVSLERRFGELYAVCNGI